MKQTGAQIVANVLEEQGVNTVFGFPGGQVLNIYDALYEHRDKLRHVLTCHEQGAAHAADGFARATGKTGVVIATSGPGATNLVTGIATAYLDSSPMVAITGNVPTNLLGRDSFQEVDITGVTMPVTKHNFIVKDTARLAHTLREAFQIAREGRPGPVLVDIPKDVQINTSEYEALAPAKKESAAAEIPGRVLELIAQAKRPFIYAGGGVVLSGAGGLLLELAERLDAPVGFSMMGLSALPAGHPRNLGLTGMHGRPAAGRCKAEADLIIAAGVRFSDRATGNKAEYCKGAKILHLDIDPAEIGKNIAAYSSLVGDLPALLKGLLQALPAQPRPEWAARVKQVRAEEQMPDNFPAQIIRAASRYAKGGYPVATDVGQHQMWAAQHYPFTEPRTFITSGGLGTMGFGMGAAIGAAVGTGLPALLFTGDGSFHMNLSELATAVTEKLPLRIFVMNNGVLGMVRQWQTLFFGQRYSQTTLQRQTDYVRLAESFGAAGLTISEPGHMEAVIAKAMDTLGPVVIDCRIGPDEKVLPMIPPGGTINDIILK